MTSVAPMVTYNVTVPLMLNSEVCAFIVSFYLPCGDTCMLSYLAIFIKFHVLRGVLVNRHSIPVGGGNALAISYLPTANKHQKRRRCTSTAATPCVQIVLQPLCISCFSDSDDDGCRERRLADLRRVDARTAGQKSKQGRCKIQVSMKMHH